MVGSPRKNILVFGKRGGSVRVSASHRVYPFHLAEVRLNAIETASGKIDGFLHEAMINNVSLKGKKREIISKYEQEA